MRLFVMHRNLKRATLLTVAGALSGILKRAHKNLCWKANGHKEKGKHLMRMSHNGDNLQRGLK